MTIGWREGDVNNSGRILEPEGGHVGEPKDIGSIQAHWCLFLCGRIDVTQKQAGTVKATVDGAHAQ